MTKKFETVQDNEDSGIVKCLSCGYQFDWDVHEEINLEFNKRLGWLELCCPACSALPDPPEHKCEDDGGMFFGSCKVCGEEMG